MSPLQFESLGLIDYSEGRRIQEEWRDRKLSGRADDVVFFCEHPPVVTLGKRAGGDDLRLPAGKIEEQGIKIHRVGRGGEATMHSPGQMVVYPVISLPERQLGVRQFVLTLLESIATVARHFGVRAQAIEDPAGVFVENRKLGAVGLQISRGITNHGLAFNVSNDLELFSLIVPCGRPDISASSLSAECGKQISTGEVEGFLRKQLNSAFSAGK